MTRRIVPYAFLGLVVVVLVVTGFLGVRYATARATENARDSSLAAAKQYVQWMYAWTPQNISDNINKTMSVLTGKAKEDYQKRVVENRIAEKVKQQQSVAKVTDQGSGVMENTRDTAKVLLFINQSASRGNSDQVSTNPSRVVYTMERSGGAWLINDIEIVDDDSLRSRITDGSDADTSTAVPIPAPSSSTPASSVPVPVPSRPAG
ncbi:MAG: hypothetical protein QM658_07340 [Gordonia sp. (in: high G+C Gram-positive bacteria)]